MDNALEILLLAWLGEHVFRHWFRFGHEVDEARAYLDKECGRSPRNLEIARDHVKFMRVFWTALFSVGLIFVFNL